MHIGRNSAITIIAALTVLAWLYLPAYAQSRQFKPNELLVKFKTKTSEVTKAGLHGAVKMRATKAIGRSDIQRITLPDDVSVPQAVAIYTNHPDVLYAEPNYRLQTQVLPNDPDLDLQWALSNSGQEVEGYVGTPGADLDTASAWDITSGSRSIVVAVLDTGCDYNHPDLAANTWTNDGEIAGNGIDDDNNGFIDDYYGWDFSNNDSDPQDGSGHGTHVAGIIAAHGHNNLGISGVAWQTKVMPVRFIDTFDRGYIDDAIEAIRYATAQGARIINCSWGTSEYSIALRDEMANTDALFICAAGNSASDTDINGFYPAGYNTGNIIAVAASNQMDQLTYFSNYGQNSVDVAAPGIRIISLQYGRQALWQDNFSDLDLDGWTTGGTGDTWVVASPPAPTDEPALATNPGLGYANDVDMWAQSPLFEMNPESSPELTFRLIGQSEAGADHLFVEASLDGTNWSQPPVMLGSTVQAEGISGTVPYWMPVRVDLNAWENQAQLYLRWRFQSDATITRSGFYLDDFELTTAAAQSAYTFMDGTSMAAGFVSGLAALVLSQDDALTVAELKSIIENSVDVDLGLVGELSSGGRINAYNALTLLEDLSLSASTAATNRINLSWAAQTLLDEQVVIQRRAHDQAEFQTVAQVDADVIQYEDSNLSPESTYYYRVHAATLDGRSGYSNQTLATTQEPSGSGGSSGGGCFIRHMTVDN